MCIAGRTGSIRSRQVLIHRRAFMLGAASVALAGCDLTTQSRKVQPRSSKLEKHFNYNSIYAAIRNDRFEIPAVNFRKINRKYLRQLVPYHTAEQPGTIVVDPDRRLLYLVLEGSRAIRYGVGVGREGFGWSGRAIIGRKAEWPTWTPPQTMIDREPKLAKYANGMPPGLDNPLGARALYLYQNGRDTLYRLHGTNEPSTIGKADSSGCIRMFNQDVIDLYNRTTVGTVVVVLHHSRLPELAMISPKGRSFEGS